MDNIVNRHTTKDAFVERRDDFVAIFERTTFQTTQRSAIFFGDDDIMGNVNQTTSEVSSIGRFHSGVGQTFTCTVRRDEVFEHRHTFLKVRKDWVFDDLLPFGTGLLRLSHQSTHTRKLLDLVLRTAGSGVEHHVDRIKSLVSFGHLFHQDVAKVVVDVCPRINNLIITFGIGDETHFVVGLDLVDLSLSFLYNAALLFRNDDIIEVE